MNYYLLTIEERSCIRKYDVDGLSYRQIARLIGRSPSTISREIRRNCTQWSAQRVLSQRKKPFQSEPKDMKTKPGVDQRQAS